MGKYNVKGKKRPVGLEIVPQKVEVEVVLPESRKSDDKPLKKVKRLNKLQSHIFDKVFGNLGKMGESSTCVGVVWQRHQLP